MTKQFSWTITLMATTFLGMPATALPIAPTLDSLKAEASSVLPGISEAYSLTELSGDLPDGAVKVTVGDKGYYFTPKDSDAELLTVLAGTSAGILVEKADGLFEYGGKTYSFDTVSIPSSAFVYLEGSKDDYDFIVQETDAEGKLNNRYYKISMLQNKFSTAENISWEKVSAEGTDTVKIELPNGNTQYFKYTFTDNPSRTKYTSSQTSLSGDVNADFVNIKKGFSSGGGINNSRNTIDSVLGSFVFDYAPNGGGAIYNAATIGDIQGDFVGNYTGLARAGQKGNGGAIYNYKNSEIGNITANFIGNAAGQEPGDGSGGAIYNEGTVGEVSGDFVANTAVTNGGAVSNNGIMGNITGDFVGNHANGKNGTGGAVYNGNSKILGNITGDFIGNSAEVNGGALYNYHYGKIGNITGNFIGNSAGIAAGAILNEGTIDKITGDFIANKANSNVSDYGAGAINNGGMGIIGEVNGNFIGNATLGNGGAIKNHKEIGRITGDFIGNSAGKNGGAIYNELNKTVGLITGDFINNSATENGGAVYTRSNMTFSSNADTHFMSGNHTQDAGRGKIYNAVYGTDTSVFTFDTSGGGAWVINDNLENGKYNFTGDDIVDADAGTTSQYVAVNADIVNAGSVAVSGTTLKFGDYQHDDKTAQNWDGKGAFVASLNADGSADRDAVAVTSLSLNNAIFNIANGYRDTVRLRGYSATDSFLHVDVNPDNMTADELYIAGNVEGVTKMIVHSSSDTDIRGKGGILFAQSENDTTGNEGSFVVSRVYRSPYLYEVNYTSVGNNANRWDLVMNDVDNPDKNVDPDVPDVPDVPEVPGVPDKPVLGKVTGRSMVAPEVVAYQALPVAALEQTRGMIGNVDRQVQGSRLYCPGCGFYDYSWDGEPFNAMWANAVYHSSKSKDEVDIDADVWGFEAGATMQHDLYNKLGLFVSYRKGNYDMSGNGEHYYSMMGSEIDIDSYLGGLYYRHNSRNWWAFATLYGGIQKVDLKTKDGITSDTEGTEFGGSVELGYDYALTKSLYVTPSAGLFYTDVNYDDARDNAGKIAKYASLRQLEAEFGVRLTKKIDVDGGYANIYVRPLVIQTFSDGGDVKVTGLRNVNALKNQTLGRIEIGGRYGFSDKLSAYGWANYTFGSDYDASSLGLGASYNL